MSEKFRTLGFLIQKEDFSDDDQFLTFFTKDFGKISVLAKGIRKTASKLKMRSDLFNFSEIEFVQGLNHKILTDIFLFNSFLKTKKYLSKVYWFYRISRDVDELIFDQEKDERIFSLLLETFQKIEHSFVFKKIALSYLSFFWRLIFYLGYFPNFFECLACKEKGLNESVFFVFKEGGFFCKKCYNKEREKEAFLLEPSLIKIIRLFFQEMISVERLGVERALLNRLLSFSERYFLFLTNKIL